MNLSDLSFKTLSRKISRFFRRFHIILYFIFVAVSFGAAVLYLNVTIQEKSTDSLYSSSIDAGSIDSTTLERIKNLRSSDETSSLPEIPTTPRINPFSE